MGKRKFKSTEEINTEEVNDFIPSEIEDIEQATSKIDAVIEAAQELLDLYASTHTITGLDSYKYPGMQKLIIALSKYRG